MKLVIEVLFDSREAVESAHSSPEELQEEILIHIAGSISNSPRWRANKGEIDHEITSRWEE